MPAPGTLISIEDWRKSVEAGEQPADALLRKQYVAEVEKVGEGDDSRVRRFVISTASRDRDHDSLALDGWRLENYRKNPVVLWAHMYRELPVGQSLRIEVGESLVSEAQFPTRDEYPFADTVLRLIDGRYLRATSVGFRPLKYVYNAEEAGYDFHEQELLEYSIVPVPANPEALQQAKSAGIDLLPLKEWAERVLDETTGEPGLYLPKSKIERVLAIAGGEPVKVLVPGIGHVEGWDLKVFDTEGNARAADEPLQVEPKTADAPVITLALEDGKVIARAGDQVVQTLELPTSEPEPTKEGESFLIADDHDSEEKFVLPFDAEDFRSAVGESVKHAVAEARTALTGRLD